MQYLGSNFDQISVDAGFADGQESRSASCVVGDWQWAAGINVLVPLKNTSTKKRSLENEEKENRVREKDDFYGLDFRAGAVFLLVAAISLKVGFK